MGEESCPLACPDDSMGLPVREALARPSVATGEGVAWGGPGGLGRREVTTLLSLSYQRLTSYDPYTL